MSVFMMMIPQPLRSFKCVKGPIWKLAGVAAPHFHFLASFTSSTSSSRYQKDFVSPPSIPKIINSSIDRVPQLVLPALNDGTTGSIVYRFFNPINGQVSGIEKKQDSILPKTARHFWSSQGWLAFIDSDDCGLYLWAPPFSSSSNPNNDVIKLPSIESLPSIAGVTRNDDGSVEKFRTRVRGNYFVFREETPETLSSQCYVRQLAFSSPPSSGSTSSGSECKVMATHGEDKGLAFCKLGDTTWTDLEAPYPPYLSITYCSKDQLFYAINGLEMVEAWDVHDPSSIKRIALDRYMDYPVPEYRGLQATLRTESNKKFYLVESSGDLLLVVRHYFDDGCTISRGKQDSYQTVAFDVYKFDIASPTKWTLVEHLQNRALFLGQTNPFSLCTSDFPGLAENSIYFADDCRDIYEYDEQIDGHDTGVFNLEEKSLKFCYPFGSVDTFNPPPVWIAPSMCG